MNIFNVPSSNFNEYKTPIIEVTKRTANQFAEDVKNGLQYFNKTSQLIVATEADKVTGFVQLRKLRMSSLGEDGYNHNNYRLDYIVVDKDHQHKGIGQGLFNKAVQQLKEKRAETMDLIYYKKDDQDGRLTRFYTQLGQNKEFSHFKNEKNISSMSMIYYFNLPENVI